MKGSKETLDFKYTLDQIDIIDIYKTFHPMASEYILFNHTHNSTIGFKRKKHKSNYKSMLRSMHYI